MHNDYLKCCFESHYTKVKGHREPVVHGQSWLVRSLWYSQSQTVFVFFTAGRPNGSKYSFTIKWCWQHLHMWDSLNCAQELFLCVSLIFSTQASLNYHISKNPLNPTSRPGSLVSVLSSFVCSAVTQKSHRWILCLYSPVLTWNNDMRKKKTCSLSCLCFCVFSPARQLWRFIFTAGFARSFNL